MSIPLCLVRTRELTELAASINEPINLTEGLVALWQGKNNNPPDKYPTISELKAFRIAQRGGVQLDDIFNCANMEDFFSDNWGKGEKIDIGIKEGEKASVGKVRDLFNRFNNGEHSKGMNLLAGKVFPLLERLNLEEITFDNDNEFKFGVQGFYTTGFLRYRHDYFSHPNISNEAKAHVLLHEAVHAVTVYAIRDYERGGNHISAGMKNAVETIYAVYGQIKTDSNFEGEYGITDAKEMIAEIANPLFVEKLKQKKLWGRIVGAIKGILGIRNTDSKETTAYRELNESLDYMLENFDDKAFYNYSGRKVKDTKNKTTTDGNTSQSNADDFFASYKELTPEQKSIFTDNKSMKANNAPVIEIAQRGAISKTAVLDKNNSRVMYIFTDNLDRTSGSQPIREDTAYNRKYGQNRLIFRPAATTAVIRGVSDNVFPVTTMKSYRYGKDLPAPFIEGDDKYERNRFQDTDEDFELFKNNVDEEFAAIQEAWNSGKYDKIVMPKLTNSSKSDIRKDGRRARYYDYLESKVRELTGQAAQLDDKVNSFKSILEDGLLASTEEFESMLVSMPYMKIRDRSSLIARQFSLVVDLLYKKALSDLDNAISQEKDIDKVDEFRKQKFALTRFDIIKRETPQGIFNRIKQNYDNYLALTLEGQMKTVTENDSSYLQRLQENQSNPQEVQKILQEIKQAAKYKTKEYQLISQNFKSLAEISSLNLAMIEGIKISNFDSTISEVADSNHDEDEPTTGNKINESKDDNSKDGWMINVRQISSHESLSQEVRKMIREIIKVNKNNKVEKDDLGYDRYLDADYVHATLIDKLKDMVDDSDLIPMLEQLSNQKPWIKQIIRKLQNNDVLMSQFYQDMRKDFLNYRKLKSKPMYDGSSKVESIVLNKPEGIYYLLDEWRDTYESGEILDSDSVYNKKGDINKDNALKGLSMMTALQDKYNRLKVDEQANTMLDPNNTEDYNNLTKALAMLGVAIDPFNLQSALNRTAQYANSTNIMGIINSLVTIFNGIKNNELEKNAETDESGAVYYDMINTFGSAFNKIAFTVATVTENAIESSVRLNGKSYYSHTTPSYLLKTIKQLKNVAGNNARFQKFIDREFGRFEWFKNADGTWNNTWLEKLVNDPEVRSIFDHHVLLNFDNKEYGDWDALDYTRVLIEEYFSEPKNGKAWYAVPILSDSASAEFIRFTKYESNSDGTYEDKIINEMVKVVMQEYNRIQLVKQRALVIKPKDKVKHYDTTLDEEGQIVKGKEGGAEFKFMPALNSYKIGALNFLDYMEQAKAEENADAMREVIIKALKDIISNEFEDTMKYWYEIGLFTNTEGNVNSYKYFNNRTTNKAKNDKLLKTLSQIEERIILSNEERMPNYIKKALSNGKYVNHKVLTKYLQNYIEELQNLEDGDIYIDAINRYNDNTREMLREFFYNDFFAKSQIIELTITDPAYYKNNEDFTKRFKEVHAPSLRLNTQSKYGKALPRNEFGQAVERTIYLKDSEISSNVKELIKKALDNNKFLSKIDKDYILSQYDKINVADAQAYRSIKSYRDIMDMSGQWDENMERAYEHLKSGNWTIEDFNIIWQTKKPYVYTQVGIKNGVNSNLIKMGVQHKNSEFLLLAAESMLYGNSSNPDDVKNTIFASKKLRAINDFMSHKGIDVVQFESTTKVGLQGTIDLSQVENYEDVWKALQDATQMNGNSFDDSVVHEIPYEDYGIQSATPEHIIDTEQLFGTQIRKLIASDMEGDANGMVTLKGKTMSRQDWWKHYNKLITENIFQSFREVDELFEDPKEVEKAIQIEANRNNKYNQDIKRACTLNADGYFELPLFDQVQSQMIQQLLNSIIKNRITKQKIKGGSLIQVSNYGLTDELNIVFKDNQGNKISFSEWKKHNLDKTKDDFNAYIKKALENKEVSIVHFECYMPAYSREFYEPLMNPVTKQLDINLLDEELRKAIGYRVPTEDKYSMTPLYIKGFLPQQNGSAIMLPSEITVIAGSDFDVDKLYVMLPEFKTNYSIDKAWNDFYKDPENSDIAKEINDERFKSLEQMLQRSNISVDDIEDWGKVWKQFNAQLKKQGIHNYDFSDSAKERFSAWFRKNKNAYVNKKKPFIKINYDESKTEGENSQKARNNRMIDMMWEVLTDKNTSHKLLKPGGFVEQKRAARITKILEISSIENIKKALGTKATTADAIIKDLLNASPDTLDRIWDIYKPKMTMLSTKYQIVTHQSLMNGANLIGSYANHNANHALMQWTKLEIVGDHRFTLNGKQYSKLNKIRANEEFEGDTNSAYISNNNAGYLAASVDNAKEQVLADLNQNSFTIDTTMLLSRLGHTPVTISLFLNQPIIKEITKRYLVEKSNGTSVDTIIEEVISSWATQMPDRGTKGHKSYKELDYTDEWLSANIINEKLRQMYDLNSVPIELGHLRDLARNQVSVGNLFKKIYKEADVLKQLVQATRADTSGGAVGPTIGDTLIKTHKLLDFLDSAKSISFPFDGVEIIKPDLLEKYKDGKIYKEQLMKDIENSPVPMLQAFHTLGLEASSRFFGKYFPHYNDSFMEVIYGKKNEDGEIVKKGIVQLSKYGTLDAKTINNIFNELFTYIMNKNMYFGSTDKYSAETKRHEFINNFPAMFRKLKEEKPELRNIEFLNRIVYIKAGKKNPVDVLVFKNVGHLSKTLKDRYTNEWASMLMSSDKEIQALASQLFLYSYFKNGFGFGPSSFAHLAPLVLRKAIPNYREDLYALINNNQQDDYSNYLEQYIYNHLDNKRIVASISKKVKIISPLEDNQKDIKDFFEIIGPANGVDADDKMFFKSVLRNPETNQYGYDYYNYISFSNKGKPIYYKLVKAEGAIAQYERITPLGWKNQFLEYEYGVSVDNMTSAISKNSKFNSIIEDDAFEKKIATEQANSEKLGTFEDSDDSNDYSPSSDEISFSNMTREERAEAIQQRFAQGGGVPISALFNLNRSSETFLSPSQEDLKREVKDNTGESICGN